MLEFVGSHDFGGLTAARRIVCAPLAGREGCLFVFVVRERVGNEGGEEILFHFEPVFVRSDGEIDTEAAQAAATGTGNEIDPPKSCRPDCASAFSAAKRHLKKKRDLWNWEDDVEFIGLSGVEFVA
jgi:hypothetical protein